MERPIRILHLLPTLSLGGAELYVRRLVRGHDRSRFDARVLAMKTGGPVVELLEQDGTPFQVLGLSRASVMNPFRAGSDLVRVFRATLNAVRSANIDIIQTHLPDADWLGYLVGKRAGLPALITCHSTRFLPQERASSTLRARARLALMTRVYPRAAGLVPVGQDVRDALLGIRGVRPENVHLVPSGIDFPPQPDPETLTLLRERHAGLLAPGGAASDGSDGAEAARAPQLVSVGRLVARKGFDLVLEAFAELRVRHPAARLWIVGQGPERGSLEALAERLGLGAGVQFLGARQDVDELLALADLFLTGSRVEGLGLAAAEALAATVPVVAFRISGLVDVVEDGRTGILVPDGDAGALARAAAELIGDPDRRSVMGLAGRESARRFDVARSRAELERIYTGLAPSGMAAG